MIISICRQPHWHLFTSPLSSILAIMTPRRTSARLIAPVPGGVGRDYGVNMRARLSGNVRLTCGTSLLNRINTDISPQWDTSDIHDHAHLCTHSGRDGKTITTAAMCRPMNRDLLKTALTQFFFFVFFFLLSFMRNTLQVKMMRAYKKCVWVINWIHPDHNISIYVLQYFGVKGGKEVRNEC